MNNGYVVILEVGAPISGHVAVFPVVNAHSLPTISCSKNVSHPVYVNRASNGVCPPPTNSNSPGKGKSLLMYSGYVPSYHQSL